MRPLRWWAESAPPGGNRVKVSENLGATSVAPVAPVDTSLNCIAEILFEGIPFTKSIKKDLEILRDSFWFKVGIRRLALTVLS